MRNTILTLFTLCLCVAVQAQQAFSLQQAMDFAVRNSYTVQTAELDLQAAKSKIKETTAIGLPQVSSAINYQNFVDLPVQLVPAEFFGGAPGTFAAVQFGQEQSMGLEIQATQIVFNGSYLVGLQAAKAYADFAKNQTKKTKLEVRQDVANAYYTVVAARENLAVLEKSITTLRKAYSDTRALYENGLVEEQSADQLKINLTNLENNLLYAGQQVKQALNFLKFSMGLPITSEITLTESIETLTSGEADLLMDVNLNYRLNIDYRLALDNIRLQELNLKNEKAAFLPTINAFYSHQQNAYSNDFTFLEKSQNYFPTNLIGVSLNIPIFSSGMRMQKAKQARYELEKAKIAEVQAKEGITMEQESARNEYKFQLSNFENQKANLSLASKIKEKTLIKFQEGVASSFDVNQSESQFLDAQGGYIKSLIDLLNAKTRLLKAYNRL